MNQKIDIHKAGAVIIKDRHFLVTRSIGKDIFVAPGGKLEPGETSKQSLVRELQEELDIAIKEIDLEHIGTFTAQAAGNESKTVQMEVFFFNGHIGDPKASREVEEIIWVNSKSKGVKLGSIFEHEVMPLLKEKGLID